MPAPETETEFVPVPKAEQLDHDEDGSQGPAAADSDAIDDATGNDTAGLTEARDRDAAVWGGPE